MRNDAVSRSLVGLPGSDSHQLVAADLRNLIAQVENVARRIEIAMTLMAGDQGGPADLVVLDDVTPRYAAVVDALGACKARLHFAMHDLADAGAPAPSL